MTDERQDDEILGRALSRAIETIDVNETPFEKSRVTGAPARRGFSLWQVGAAAAAVVLALALGAWFTRPGEGPVGGTSGTPAATVSPVATRAVATPTVSATPEPTTVNRTTIYLGRLAAPPVGVAGPKFGDNDTTAVARIASRVTALRAYRQNAAPQGLTNYLWNNSFQGGLQVTVAGDLATVDLRLDQPFAPKDPGVASAILQQLVYTATEEPGIRRVLLTENGGQPLMIGDIRVGKPLAREDVFGYKNAGAVGLDNALAWAGDDTIPHVVAKMTSLTNDGTTTRLTFLGTSGNTETPTALPSFSIALESNDDTRPVGGKTAAALNGGKYQMRIGFQWNGGGSSGGIAGTTIVDQTPVRATISANPTLLVELDDARPWRAWMPDKTQLVVEIGGDPRSTSDRIAVRAPIPGSTIDTRISRTLTLSGAARVFEANVSWRLKDGSGKTAANGHFLASLGSSALWGTFDAPITIPTALLGTGPVTLELYEASPKDGTEQGIVAIPLLLR